MPIYIRHFSEACRNAPACNALREEQVVDRHAVFWSAFLCGRQRNVNRGQGNVIMKTKLFITVAMAALIAGSAGALAQEEHGGGTAPGAAQHQTAPSTGGGAAQHGQTPGGGAAQHGQTPGGGAAQHGQTPGSAQTQMKPSGGRAEQKSVQGGAEEHGTSEMRRGAQSEPGRDESGKAGVNSQERAQTQSGKSDRNAEERSKQENAQSQERVKQENAQSQERGRTQENAQGTPQERGGGQQNAQGRSSSGKSVQLSESQRTQIKSVVVKDHNVARVDHVNFSINVGVAVPRTVHVAALPADIIEVVPEYRGFDYVVVGDQLLIIDPDTMMIVEVLPV
jgi:hypothetical protein